MLPKTTMKPVELLISVVSLQIQLVHFRTLFKDYVNARKNQDGLAILSVFVEVRGLRGPKIILCSIKLKKKKRETPIAPTPSISTNNNVAEVRLIRLTNVFIRAFALFIWTTGKRRRGRQL